MHFVVSSRVIGAIVTAMAFVAAADTAIAQQYTATTIPQIVVSGSSDVNLPPAKAAFSISISTTGPSSAVASEDNARISKAVLDALDRSGLKGKDITGSHLSVNPRWDYDPK